MIAPRLLLVAALWVGISSATLAQTHESRFGENRYIEYRPGDLPVILTAPHGGRLQPGEIADRTSGVLGGDRNTFELTEALADAFAARAGGRRPHVIVTHLARRKLDPNRDIEEAAQGDPHAERAWREFHGFITEAREAVVARHRRGLLLDIHGHGHPIQQIEIGYALPGNLLNRDDAGLNRPDIAEKAAIRTTLTTAGPSFADILRGPRSLGAEFERRGIPAIPSPTTPGPHGNPYFSGGYITRTHGSMSGGAICAIQLEHHFRGIRDTDRNRRDYAAKVVDAVDAFLKSFTEVELGLEPEAPKGRRAR